MKRAGYPVLGGHPLSLPKIQTHFIQLGTRGGMPGHETPGQWAQDAAWHTASFHLFPSDLFIFTPTNLFLVKWRCKPFFFSLQTLPCPNSPKSSPVRPAQLDV
eukprot:EG_transcript_64168